MDDEVEQVRNNLEGVEGALSNVLESIENGLDPKLYPSLGERLSELQSQRDELREALSDLNQRQKTFSGDMSTRRALKLGVAVRDHPEDKTLINAHMRKCFSEVVVDFLSGDLVFHWKHGGKTRLLYKVPAFDG